MALAKIVYASMTGNTEESQISLPKNWKNWVTLQMQTSVQRLMPLILKMRTSVSQRLYTYGDGELPDEIVDFYEDLADLDLSGKIFGVVGSGDTFYDEFCKAVDDFDRCFAATGAEKGSECVKVDLSAEDEDIEKLEAFAEELVAKAN